MDIGNVALRKKEVVLKPKAKAWMWFSRYIRKKSADESGLTTCVTCGKPDHWKNLQAGHFIDGRNNSVLFDERLVHVQCFHCNSKRPGCLAGNKVIYTLYMLTLGYDLNDILGFEHLKFKIKKITKQEFEEIADKYERKFNEL